MQLTADKKLNNRKPKMGGKAKRNIFIILMLAYPVIQFIVFWGAVNINTIIMTFQRQVITISEGDYSISTNFSGFQNYGMVFRNILNDEFTQRRLINSLLYMPVNSFIILPLSLIFSYFLAKKVPLSNFFRVVFFLPSILPIVVLTMSFGLTLDPTFGPINSILKSLFGEEYIPPSWFGFNNWPLNQTMILVYCTWAGLGANIVLLNGAISRIPQEIIEYGKLEGISYTKEFLHVVIPMIWPTIATTFMLGCTAVFIIMMQPMLLTPIDPSTDTIALMIYNSVYSNGDSFYTATFGVVLSLIGAPIILLIRKFMLSRYKDVEY